VRIALRISALVLIFLGARWAALWGARALSGDSVVYAGERVWPSYGVTIAFYLLTAGLLVVGEPTIVRWVVPYSAGGCLGCGYPAAGASRCPECGRPIPDDAPGPADNAGAS